MGEILARDFCSAIRGPNKKPASGGLFWLFRGKDLGTADLMAVDAVRSERGSVVFPCYQGYLQGIIPILAQLAANDAAIPLRIRALAQKFPTRRNRELRTSSSAEQGMLRT